MMMMPRVPWDEGDDAYRQQVDGYGEEDAPL